MQSAQYEGQLGSAPWQRWIGARVVAPDGAEAEVWSKAGTDKAPMVALWRAGRILPLVPQHEAKRLPLVGLHPVHAAKAVALF